MKSYLVLEITLCQLLHGTLLQKVSDKALQYAIISITKTSIVRQENCQFSVTWCSFFSQPNMFFNINKINQDFKVKVVSKK